MQIVALTNSLLESNNEQENTGNLWEKTGLSHITAGCRIAHCVVSGTLREAYLTRKTAPSCPEKDAMGTDTEQANWLQLVTDLYNNPEYSPHSLILPLDEFGPWFTESHALIPLGKSTMIDKEHFQRTYNYLLTQAKIVKSNWEASGNGEEMPSIHGYDELLLDSSMEGSSDEDSNNERYIRRNSKKIREIGLDGEDAYVKQSLILDQTKSIDFD